MRTTRAFIAGLGTTGSLVAAVACAFVVVSAVVAFHGWPGVAVPERVANVVVGDGIVPAAATRTSAAPARIVVSTAPRTEPGVRDGASGTSRRPSTPDRTRPRPGGKRPSPAPPPVAPSDDTPPPDHTPRKPPTDLGPVRLPPIEPPKPIPVPAPLDSVTSGLAEVVRDTTDGVGQVVTDVSSGVGSLLPAKPLDSAVAGVGGAVGDTVKGTGNLVGGLLDGLTVGRR
jgi:hypothetical protein